MSDPLSQHWQQFAMQSAYHNKAISPIQKQQALKYAEKEAARILDNQKKMEALPDVQPQK
jgi:hypothetical protein